MNMCSWRAFLPYFCEMLASFESCENLRRFVEYDFQKILSYSAEECIRVLKLKSASVAVFSDALE